jgi:hypothetical protein
MRNTRTTSRDLGNAVDALVSSMHDRVAPPSPRYLSRESQQCLSQLIR